MVIRLLIMSPIFQEDPMCKTREYAIKRKGFNKSQTFMMGFRFNSQILYHQRNDRFCK